ncbi:MAG TPA: hypothetical protein VH540_25520 [Ktedonobacterales bacterium]|jgi:hypothetical protein
MELEQIPTSGDTNISTSGPVTGKNFIIGQGTIRVFEVVQQFIGDATGPTTDYATRLEHFYRAYLGTEEHPVPFGGRNDELRRFDAWLEAEGAPPYLLLAAPAGRGKSAFLVQWHSRLLTRSDLTVTFFPISVRFRTHLAGVVFPTLATRLAGFHGEQLTITPSTPQEVWREYFAAYLARPLPDGRRHLLILDGLDEAADWEITEDLFPVLPPDGLRVIVSARYLAGDRDAAPWLRRLGWEDSGYAQTLELGPLSQAGVAEVVQTFAPKPGQENGRASVARELHRLSEGDPLLVHLYLEHLREQQSEDASLHPKDLQAIRPGLEGYFNHWWQDQRRLWGQNAPLREPAVQEVLNLLSCAMGPLSQEALLALAPPERGLSTWMLEETLRPLQRFVLGDGRQQGYTLSHPRLGQYFYDQLSRPEQQANEGRFLKWGQQTLAALTTGQVAPEHVSPYLVQYYGAHLARAGAGTDALLALVSAGWQQAWEALEGAYAGFLGDAARAWHAAEQADEAAILAKKPTPYLGEEVRCALCHASINSMAKHLPGELLLALVKEGLWAPAQGLAYVRQIPDTRQQAQALVDLTRLVEGPLQGELAHEALERVLLVSNGTRRSELLARLLPYLPGDIQEQQISKALEAATASSTLTDRAAMLLALAPALAEPHQEQLWQETLDTARAIPHPTNRARALAALVSALPESSRGSAFEIALDAASQIDDEAHRSQVLASLAVVVPERLQRQLLLMTTSMQNRTNQTRVLVALTPALPDARKQQILDAIHALPTRDDRLPLLLNIIPALPLEMLRQVLERVKAIVYSADRARLLSTLAPCMPEHEQHEVWQLAWEAATAITHEASRAKTLASMAPELPAALRHQGLHEALQAVRAIWDTSSRAEALMALAPAASEGARLDLLGVLQSLPAKEERLHLLTHLAPHLAPEQKEQVLAEVLTDALAIRTKDERLHLLLELAPVLTGEPMNALFAYAQGIKDEDSRVALLSALAPTLPEILQRELLHNIKSIKQAVNRAPVLIKLISGSAGELKQAIIKEALQTVQAIKNEMSQASLLAKLAPDLPDDLHQQVVGKAFTQASALKNEHYQAQVLAELAPALPENLQEQALSLALSLNYGPDRTQVLAALLPVVPEPRRQAVLQETLAVADTLKEDVSRLELFISIAQFLPGKHIEQLYESIQSVKQDAKRVELLLALAPRLQGALLEQVLPSIQALINETKRTETLAQAAPHLARLPTPLLYTYWRSMLHAASRRTRGSVLKDLAALQPFILALGGQPAIEQTFQAIREVGQWWP